MKLLRKSGGSHFFDSLRPPAQPGASDVRESLAVFAPAGAGSFCAQRAVSDSKKRRAAFWMV